ncbi:MAG: FAD-dependent oxidoreductase, partial [Rubrobacteraceae bacterium]
RWSPKSFELRDFLGRNQVAYQWVDVRAGEESEGAPVGIELDGKKLPLVVLPDGTELEEPETLEVAESIGLSTQAEKPFYDVIIIGAGPAGLATAVYGASEGLRIVMIEREAPGGQAGTSSRIENYLGFPSGLSGADLARRGVTQAKRFGVEILTPQEVRGVRVEDPYRIVELSDGSELSCHALVITTGVSYRMLDAPGLDKFAGAGVYYGASMSEARSCEDEEVFIVGGANSAGQAAVYFAGFANKVTMLVRADNLGKGMSQYLVDQIGALDNIEVRTNTTVAAVDGEDSLQTVTVENGSGEQETLEGTSIFLFIGAEPRTDWLDGVVERDARGYIPVGLDLMRDGKRPDGWKLDRDPYWLETSVPGIFASGDVVRGSTKRIAYGVGGGAIAVQLVHQYLSEV